MLLVAIVAGSFLYRMIKKNRSKKAIQEVVAEPGEASAPKQWKTNLEPKEVSHSRPVQPRPVAHSPPPAAAPSVHPAVGGRVARKPVRAPMQQNVPNQNNPTRLPPADNDTMGGPTHMRPETTRPSRPEGFNDVPPADHNPVASEATAAPPAPAAPAAVPSGNDFTEL